MESISMQQKYNKNRDYKNYCVLNNNSVQNIDGAEKEVWSAKAYWNLFLSQVENRINKGNL